MNKTLKKHQKDYRPNAFQEYSPTDLANAVAFLIKRATHRLNTKKAKKDLYDAKNYFGILETKILG